MGAALVPGRGAEFPPVTEEEGATARGAGTVTAASACVQGHGRRAMGKREKQFRRPAPLPFITLKPSTCWPATSQSGHL